MLAHSLLGVLLHTCIEGCEDAQTVSIYVVGFAVSLFVLVTPTEERVFFPRNRVEHKLAHLPLLVVCSFGFLLHHIMAQEYLEVVARAFYVL